MHKLSLLIKFNTANQSDLVPTLLEEKIKLQSEVSVSTIVICVEALDFRFHSDYYKAMQLLCING